MTRKIITALLALALLCAMLPSSALAAETKGDCGENLRWSFDAAGVLTITGSGAMDDYSYETDAPWAALRHRITAIRLPDGLTSIGRMAFVECAGFTELTVPRNVARIGDHAFNNAKALTKITLPDGLLEIGDYAFFDCVSLEELAIPGSVESIGSEAFTGCDRLEQVLIPASVKRMGDSAFGDCMNLKEIRVDPENDAFRSEDGILFSKDKTLLIQYPCGKTGAYQIPEYATILCDSAFYCCVGLTEITIPENSAIADHPDLQYCFSSCSALEGINVPQSSTRYTSVDGVLFSRDKTELLWYPQGRTGAYQIPSGVTLIADNAFHSCVGLTAVTIPEGVTEIGTGAFFGCENLKTVTFPESLRYVGNWSFMGCSGLEEVSLSANVWSIGEAAFSGCSSVKEYKVHPDNPNLCSEDGVLFLKDKSQLLHYPGAKTGSYRIPAEVHIINYSAFTDCPGLEAIEFPAGLDFIEGLELSGCTGLTALNVDPESRLFRSEDGVVFTRDMSKLVRFPTGRTGEYRIPDGVKTIGNNAFESCALTTVIIPEGVTRVGNCALAYNGNLKSVTFPSSVSRIDGGMFTLDVSLERVTFLNPECWIDYDIYTSPQSLGDPALMTICGYRGSTAQAVADRFGFRFEEVASKTGFADVGDASESAGAVAWAVSQGITNGTTPYYFRPEAACTRAQAATLLWRAKGSPEPAGSVNPFRDVPNDQYYTRAVLWAAEHQITSGASATTFSPDSGCTRGQVVTFLWRAAGQPDPAGSGNPFVDVKPDAYYYKAVLWAVEQGITKGTSADKFSPDSTCTRGQIVTFLYRDLAN